MKFGLLAHKVFVKSLVMHIHVSELGQHLDGAKPLPEPLMFNCQIDPQKYFTNYTWCWIFIEGSFVDVINALLSIFIVRWLLLIPLSDFMMTSSNGNIFRITGHLCGKFPTQRPVTQSFDDVCHLCLNKQLSKQWWGRWFEMPPCPLWHHCNVCLAWKCRWLSLQFPALCTILNSLDVILRLCCQKQVSWLWVSNYIVSYSAVCNYLTMS